MADDASVEFALCPPLRPVEDIIRESKAEREARADDDHSSEGSIGLPRGYGPITEEQDKHLEETNSFYAETKLLIAQKLAADDALDTAYQRIADYQTYRASISRSKHSHASHHTSMGKASRGNRLSQTCSSGTGQLSANPSDAPEDGKTSRGVIESRTEKKLFKMMNQPHENDCDREETGVSITRYDYSEVTRPSTNEPPKSPKKKFLGMSIPSFKSFGSSSNIARPQPVFKMPPMTTKAAKVLGDSPPRPKYKRTQRAEATKSLPSKLHRGFRVAKPFATVGQRHPYSTPVPPRSPRSSKSPSDIHYAAREIEQIFAAEGNESPPTPPKKDTPPVAKLQQKTTSQPKSHTPIYGTASNSGVPTDVKAQYATYPDQPVWTQTDFVGADEEVDPVKYNPISADEYRELVKTAKSVTDAALAQASALDEPVAEALVEVEQEQKLDRATIERNRRRLEDRLQAQWAEEARIEQLRTEALEAERARAPAQNPLELYEGASDLDDQTSDESSERNMAPPPAAPQGRGIEETPTRPSRSAPPDLELEPRFFNPKNSPVKFGSPGRPSQNFDTNHLVYGLPPLPSRFSEWGTTSAGSGSSYPIVFQGRRSEIEFGSPTARQLQEFDSRLQQQGQVTFTDADPFTMHPLQNSSTRPADTPLHLNSARETTRLTTLLSDFTPSRANFSAGFDPDNASAVPSPLYAHPDQQARSRDRLPDPADFSTHYHPPGHSARLQMRQRAGQPMPKANMDGDNKAPTNAGVLSDGTNVLDHFSATNEHLEDQARRLALLMEKHEGEVLEAVDARQAEMVAVIKQYAEENKAHFTSLEELIKHISSEGVAVTQKIRDLMAFIRKDVFETVSAQNKRTAALENEVKQLTRIVYDLHNAFLDKAPVKPRSPIKASKAPVVPSEPTAKGQWTEKLKAEGPPAKKPADREKSQGGRAPLATHSRGKSYGESSQGGNAMPASGTAHGPPPAAAGQTFNSYTAFRARSRSPTKTAFGQDGQSK